MLEQMGIRPESAHHESGPGQNEIDFRYSDPLTAADNAVTFHAVVRTVAVQNGLCADFSPNPFPTGTETECMSISPSKEPENPTRCTMSLPEFWSGRPR